MKMMELGNTWDLDYTGTEAVNTLASNVIFSGAQYRSIMVTSGDSNEGKSFVTFQLAKKLAGLGHPVVYLDADLRKSVFFSRYDVQVEEQPMGLAHYLAGRCTLDQIEYETNIPNLYVIPIGREVVNSLPLLNSAAFRKLIDDLKIQFSYVLVDAPPLGVIIDAAMIANVCDGALFIVTSEKTSRRELHNMVSQIQKTGCHVLGAVLNKVSMKSRKSRYYYHKSYYARYTGAEYISDAAMEKRKRREDKGKNKPEE
ncbi:MAG: CpsD/CapB family tyrosine-protein kinase [Clostridia bacterium]|nr:CpsD/CapB family tyrosine-protein kinase [Clostridia bacterium]